MSYHLSSIINFFAISNNSDILLFSFASLLVEIILYHHLCQMNLVDSFLNTSFTSLDLTFLFYILFSDWVLSQKSLYEYGTTLIKYIFFFFFNDSKNFVCFSFFSCKFLIIH